MNDQMLDWMIAGMNDQMKIDLSDSSNGIPLRTGVAGVGLSLRAATCSGSNERAKLEMWRCSSLKLTAISS